MTAGRPTSRDIEMARLAQMEADVPGLWDCRSVLNIGANPDRFHYGDALRAHGCTVDVLEIDHAACEHLRTLPWLRRVYEGSVLDADALLGDARYDLVLWSHGPEVLSRTEVDAAIRRVESRADRLTVLMVPWGRYDYTAPQWTAQQYPNVCALYEEDFQRLGYRTSTLGERDVRGSNLLAWKFTPDAPAGR